MNTDDWRFRESANVAVFTVRAIMNRSLPILLVIHDRDDGGWQFLTGGSMTMKDAILVALSEVVAIDPTVQTLADLPVGWQATRASSSVPWVRSLTSQAEED